MSDTLLLHEIVAECRLGVFEWEQAKPQAVWIDVELEIDAARAAAQDDVKAAVDYAQLVTRIKALAKSRPYHLLETLAEAVASVVLGEFETSKVRVRVKKRALPGIDYAAVEVTRKQRTAGAGSVRRRARRAVGRSRTTGRFPKVEQT